MLRSRHLQRCTIAPFTYIPTVQVNCAQHLMFFLSMLIFILIIASVDLTWFAVTAEPINIFQGSYNTDVPPIRLSYHHGNHYNSVVDPRRQTVGAGLGFSSLRGVHFCFLNPFVLHLVHTVICTLLAIFWSNVYVIFQIDLFCLAGGLVK